MVIISEKEQLEMSDESNGEERERTEYEQGIFISPLPDSPTSCRDTLSNNHEMMSDISHRKEEKEDES